MKILIIYSTKHGCTEKCVMKLQQSLNKETAIVDLKNSTPPDLNNFDAIIIGGSIHAGQIQNRIKKFCHQNLAILKQRKLGLFICCMEEGENAQKEFQNAFPAELISHAIATGIFGGEFNFEKMNFIEKAIIKKIAKVDKSVSRIDENRIIEFARKIAE